MNIQDPPFAVQIELVEGCNLMCTFCGINGIREKAGNYKYLTPETAHIIAKNIRQSGWTSRIEFAMHGEPTIHKDFAGIFAIFRRYLRNQLMVTTNGVGLLKTPIDTIEKIFDAGVNIIALDDYQHADYVPRIRKALEAEITRIGSLRFSVHEYPGDSKASPHNRWKPKTRALVFIQDITLATKGGHSTLSNHCGAAAPLVQINERCAKPFRELSIRWDGNIACCCNDWRGTYKIGNINNESITDLWNSAEMQSLRKFLYNGRREVGACVGCDYRTYRNGLLPDKFGKETLEQPNQLDHEITKAASSGPAFSPVVIRPWEIGNASK